MQDYSDFDRLTITLLENRISSFKDISNQQKLASFQKRLVKKGVSKIYVVKHENNFLYVGTTVQSLTARFRYGLNADGKKGYHGYKWKHRESVDLYVWCFESLNKLQIESIEAVFGDMVEGDEDQLIFSNLKGLCFEVDSSTYTSANWKVEIPKQQVTEIYIYEEY